MYVNVTMQLLPNSMNEVVVIGYGTAKRQDVTGCGEFSNCSPN